jgi:hypothetical protein
MIIELDNIIESYPLNDLSDAINYQGKLDRCVTNIATHYIKHNLNRDDLIESLRKLVVDIENELNQLIDWGYCDDDAELSQKMIERKILPLLEEMKEEVVYH